MGVGEIGNNVPPGGSQETWMSSAGMTGIMEHCVMQYEAENGRLRGSPTYTQLYVALIEIRQIRENCGTGTDSAFSLQETKPECEMCQALLGRGWIIWCSLLFFFFFFFFFALRKTVPVSFTETVLFSGSHFLTWGGKRQIRWCIHWRVWCEFCVCDAPVASFVKAVFILEAIATMSKRKETRPSVQMRQRSVAIF